HRADVFHQLFVATTEEFAHHDLRGGKPGRCLDDLGAGERHGAPRSLPPPLATCALACHLADEVMLGQRTEVIARRPRRLPHPISEHGGRVWSVLTEDVE